MSAITEISTKSAPAPLPVFSQAIKANGFVFVSGNIGLDKDTWALVEGGIKAQTVNRPFRNIS
jgi:2-iminobutanoate/2-iminopropanoate deaminase